MVLVGQHSIALEVVGNGSGGGPLVEVHFAEILNDNLLIGKERIQMFDTCETTTVF